jgi:hypothetical protein
VNSSSFTQSNLSQYNVTAKIWFNSTLAGSWINTNFTQNTSLNMSGSYQNTSKYITANLSTPVTTLLNGSYAGYIQYSDAGANGAGWKHRIPVAFNINVPVVVVNESVYNATVRLVENTGTFRRLQFNLSVENRGSSAILQINMSNSSNLSYGTRIINFTMDNYGEFGATNSSAAGSLKWLNATLVINTSYTANTDGVYAGWITFNVTQNRTNNVSVHNIFNVSIEVNLTSVLVVNISQYFTGDAAAYNPYITGNRTQNLTMLVNVTLQNGTVISALDYGMNNSNFTSAFLIERNYTSSTYALQNITNGDTVPCKAAEFCMINASVPANVPGGRYTIFTTAQWNSTLGSSIPGTPVVLTGTGGGYPLVVWAPGIKLTAVNSTSISQGEYVDTYFNFSVTNYGPQTAESGIITMNNLCSHIVVNASTYNYINGTCTITAATSNNYFTIGNLPGNGSACWMTFKIHSNNVSGAQTCGVSPVMNITLDRFGFNNLTEITVGISDTDGTSGGTSTSTGTATPTTSYNRSVQLLSYNTNFNARLGDNMSTTVSVKNTGNATSIIWLSATTNNSAVFTTVDPSFASIAPSATRTFNVYINVSNVSKLGLFLGTFKAYVEGSADTWFESRNFDLRVEATAERKVEINLSYANYTAQLANLTSVFNSMKAGGLADAGNLTKIGELFNRTLDLVARIEAALNASDYATAESLISEMASNLNRIQADMAAAGAASSAIGADFLNSAVFWAVIGIVIAGVAGVLIYMFLPAKSGVSKTKTPTDEGKAGSEPLKVKSGVKSLFRRKEKGEAGRNAKDFDSSLKDYAEYVKSGRSGGKVEYLSSKYAEGYERTNVKWKPGRGLTRVFKRKKQEKLKDFMKKQKK